MVTEWQVRVLRRKLMEGKTQEAAAAGVRHQRAECAPMAGGAVSVTGA